MIRYVLILAVLFQLTACNRTSENSTQPSTQKSEANPLKKTDSAPQYSVIESFNVGANVVVRALVIDEKTNSLWVGTTVGMLDIDIKTGNVQRTFTRENGLANEYVFSSIIDAKGETWIGTNGGGVSRLKNENWTTYFPMHGLGDYWVYSFAEQKQKAMWIGTWNGLSRFDYKTQTFKTYVTELVNEWVYGLGVDSKNRLWIGTEGGVNMFDGKTWSTWTHEQGLGQKNINNLPFSENTGLGTRARHNLDVQVQGKNTYNPNYVFCIAVSKNDTVWAGTWGGGASYYDGNSWNNLTTENGLSGNIVYSIAIESDEVIWFGTNNGLSRYDGKTWQTFNKSSGLLDNHVYAVSVSPDGRIWAGTKDGVAVLNRM